MTVTDRDIATAARSVLDTGEPRAKAAKARAVAADWREGLLHLPSIWPAVPADHAPARPVRPELVPPGQVPRRRLNSVHGRIALLHAIAHIEFNAIDLAFDLVMRFGGDVRVPDIQRAALISDWISVGDDEARHFILVEDRLNALGAGYGDHPAHNGLWDAAVSTKNDLAARLAVAPLVLEARGLDVTPGMIERLNSAADPESAAILQTIYDEEIGHVGAGAHWFLTIAKAVGEDAQAYYHSLVRQHFRSPLKRPFNFKARQSAGFPETFYEPLAD